MCKAPEIYNLSFISPNYRDECDLLHYQTGFPLAAGTGFPSAVKLFSHRLFPGHLGPGVLKAYGFVEDRFSRLAVL